MIFDVNAPKSSQFKKPTFGNKTLLRDRYGNRTGLSYALSAGVNWMSALSPMGAGVGQQLDNLIQNNNVPSYLMDQEWYRNNVETSNAKGQATGQVAGTIGSEVRGVVEKLAGAMTGTSAAAASVVSQSASSAPKSSGAATGSLSLLKPNPVKATEDPSKTFQSMLSRKNVVMTPEQRRLNQINSQKQMLALPTYDNEIDNNMSSDINPFRFYLSDTPSIVPNFLKLR